MPFHGLAECMQDEFSLGFYIYELTHRAGGTAGEAPLHEVLSHGFAECMQDSLFEQSPFVSEADDAEGAPPGGGLTSRLAGSAGRAEADAAGGADRAMLVLQLLLGSQQGPAPNLAHLLLGFNVEDGAEGAQGASSPQKALSSVPCNV